MNSYQEWIELVLISLKSIGIYVFILSAIRIFGKKELAQLSVVDLVFILLISNAVQNAMVGNNTSLSGGIAAASGLFIFNYLFNYLIKKFPRFSKVIQGEEMTLIYNGKIMRSNLERSMFTLDELKAAIREHGVENIEDVDLAILEVDGSISILSGNYQKKTTNKRTPKKHHCKLIF